MCRNEPSQAEVPRILLGALLGSDGSLDLPAEPERRREAVCARKPEKV